MTSKGQRKAGRIRWSYGNITTCDGLALPKIREAFKKSSSQSPDAFTKRNAPNCESLRNRDGRSVAEPAAGLFP